jgi:hypothetical protein
VSSVPLIWAHWWSDFPACHCGRSGSINCNGSDERYPRRGSVSTKRGFSDESPGASELQKRLWPDTFVDVDHNLNTENCARQGGVCATPATAVIDTQ